MPTRPHQGMADSLARAPDECPAIYKDKVALLHNNVRSLMELKQLPYMIQAKLAEEGYVTMEDIADQWDSPDLARASGPKELGFESGKEGYDDKSSKLAAMKLYQVVRAAKLAMSNMSPLPMPLARIGGESSLEIPCERSQLEHIYMTKYGSKPSLEEQGSDHLLRKQYRFCMRGEIGFIHSRHLVAYLPESDERPTKRQKRTILAGLVTEEEEEERQNPTTYRQLDRMMTVFKINLLMCTGAFSQFRQFDATLTDLNSFYNWFNGPDIAGRSPQPPVNVLISAERAAWREISKSMQLGATLKESISKIQGASLFWQREVYEKMARPDKPGRWLQPYQQQQQPPFPSPSKGKGKYKGKFASYQPYKGKGKKGKKGGGKGKKGKDQWPSNWARKTPKGVEFCQAYHLRSSCQGNCNRSHNCPVMKDGWVCNQPPEKHSPSQCPNI